MLRFATGARRFNDKIALTRSEVTVDEYGHRELGEAVVVCELYAQVRQMSATKALMTFQQADVVGVELEFRFPAIQFNGIRWQGHDIVFAAPTNVDNRSRYVHIDGYYQIDDPAK